MSKVTNLNTYIDARKEADYFIDLFNVYLGIEQSEDDEAFYKSIEVYLQSDEITIDNQLLRLFVNVDTIDKILIDENGTCVDSILNEKTRVHDITGIHSFYDCLSEAIRNIQLVMDSIENGEKAVQELMDIKNAMDYAKENQIPAPMSIDDLIYLSDRLDNVYKLSYGNPLTGESKLSCLEQFFKKSNRKNKNNKDRRN